MELIQYIHGTIYTAGGSFIQCIDASISSLEQYRLHGNYFELRLEFFSKMFFRIFFKRHFL